MALVDPSELNGDDGHLRKAFKSSSGCSSTPGLIVLASTGTHTWESCPGSVSRISVWGTFECSISLVGGALWETSCASALSLCIFLLHGDCSVFLHEDDTGRT